ncbi:pilus assembly protein TadB, partial [Vibrio antiquarius]|nr:pilus assembly protein TadB [Vibrio antiquarius]
MMLIVILLWVVVALFLFIGHSKKQKEITSIIEQSNTFEGVSGSRAVIDSESFDISYRKKIKDKFKQLKKLLSPNAGIKLIGFFAG